MSQRTPRFIAAAVLAVVAALFAPASATAYDGGSGAGRDGDVIWLCHPDLAENPCEIDLDTTELLPGGGERVHTRERLPSEQRPIDCFYVYPTVSNQVALNTTKAADPEITSIARFQAAPFSSECRMFAPVYQQVPLAGLPLGLLLGGVDGGPFDGAYGDVERAWADYLANENGGRGVVLIGHSQGSLLLRRLISEHIDPDPAARARFVGGILLGGNVLTAPGSTTGGDFDNIEVCTARGQAGCVVAYSTYAANPLIPFFGSAKFDVLSVMAGMPSGKGFQVACTDPTRLSGIQGPVGVTVPTEQFAPGAINLSIFGTVLGRYPEADTTWVTTRDRYEGMCRTVNGANVFRYKPTKGSMQPIEVPPTWGTHLLDVNLGVERLISIVHQQGATWRSNRSAPAGPTPQAGVPDAGAPGGPGLEAPRKEVLPAPLGDVVGPLLEVLGLSPSSR